MTTDPRLPDILATAASGVGAVGDLLSDKARQASSGLGPALTWYGPSADTFRALSTQMGRDIGTCVGLADELAGALRRAAKSASQRLYWEAQERERQRLAELADKQQRNKP